MCPHFVAARHVPCRWQRSWRSVRRLISCLQPSRLGRRGRAWRERPACPRLIVTTVRWASGVREAGTPGMVSAGSQLTGVAVQLWGDLVIFDPLTAGFAGSAGLTYALVGGLAS